MSIGRVVLLALIAGCAQSAPSVVTKGGTLSLAEDGSMWTVDAERGSIQHVAGSGVVEEILLDGAPTRMLHIDDSMFVTLRASGEVVEIAKVDGAYEVVNRATVGSEPFGIQASPDGQTLYVALAQEDAVVALDATTLTESARFAVPGQPRWIAIEPSGKRVWAASAYGGTVHRITVETELVEAANIPSVYGFSFTTGLFDTAMTPRMTGDIEITEDGEVGVPGEEISDQEQGGYAISDTGSDPVNVSARFNTVVVQFAPDSLQGMTRLVVTQGDPRRSGTQSFVRGYPSSVVAGPDGNWYLPMENAGAVLVTPMNPKDDGVDQSGLSQGFRVAPTASIPSGLGPRGVVFTSDRMFVSSFLDREVRSVSLADVALAVSDTSETSPATRSAGLGPSGLSADLEAGRDLFYAAGDGGMSAAGRGASCSTCHLDGRNDGLTWLNPRGIRVQTPSLLGASETGPYTWAGDVASIADEAMITSAGRLGGHLGEDQAAQVQAYVASLPRIQRPTLDQSAAARGAQAFADAKCASCHSGLALTDGKVHAMFGLSSVNTPSLLNVGSTAPYMHDGSQQTLEQTIRSATKGEMGPAVRLSEQEISDLGAYLKTL